MFDVLLSSRLCTLSWSSHARYAPGPGVCIDVFFFSWKRRSDVDEKGAYDSSFAYSWIWVYDPGPTCSRHHGETLQACVHGDASGHKLGATRRALPTLDALDGHAREHHIQGTVIDNRRR